ncbi:M60 family metallopeptidase [Spiroplasma sp. SV19]|uniref:M60 family metallopeptidase n=1 Tax=Spiroplasma sp. SV19 TaxID=2570468 RepID=UPI0024B7C262|nr:M60 family metallopeptidase [Spiroplasma sp. SV19]WHQ36924.1 hypothetical protein E7Y35_03360 [Spiroplasma sp. SV19]
MQAKNTYTVIFNRNLTDDELGNIKLSIGQWGQYKNINKNKNNVFSDFVISTKSNFITFYLSTAGVLYLVDSNQTDLQVIGVRSEEPEGAIKIPTFKVNKTNQTEFIKQVKTTRSSFVEFVSNYYLATMQTDMIKNVVIPWLQHSFNVTLSHWDNVWNWSNELYGLNEKNKNINKKYSQYIHIVNEDQSGGYVNASHGRIMFQNSTGVGKDLFLNALTDQWGLWHEIGHTYQTLQYKWNYLVDVTK